MTESDPLISERGPGPVQTAAIDLEKARDNIASSLRSLDVDRRESMPQDENSLEYRIRHAYNLINGAQQQLEEAGWPDDE